MMKRVFYSLSIILLITSGNVVCEEEYGMWDSVSCYACGLAYIDPEVDRPGSYSINPNEGKKMYNHSCDLMDNGLSGDKARVERGGQLLDPKTNYEVAWDTLVYQNCTTVEGVETCVDEMMEVCKSVESPAAKAPAPAAAAAEIDPNSTETTTTAAPTTTTTVTVCESVPRTYKVSRKVRLPPKSYDEEMWLRKCPPGVRSCFKAIGNWDQQKPVFRGCSGVQYDHGTVCKREMQAVEVTPGKPKVDVEVYLCYCSGNGCNKVDIAGSSPLQQHVVLLILTIIVIAKLH